MKKFLLTTFAIVGVVLALGACSNGNNNIGQTEEQKEYVLKSILDSCLSSHPNVLNNDVTKSIFADLIRATIQKYKGDTLPFLSDIPVEYEMCIEYPKNPCDFEIKAFKNAGKYVVKFSFGEYSSGCKLSDDYDTTFQIFTIMDKEMVSKLIDNRLYYVNGKFIDFSNNTSETGFALPSGRYFIDYPKVSTSIYGEKPSINLGTLILEDPIFIPVH